MDGIIFDVDGTLCQILESGDRGEYRFFPLTYSRLA